MANDKETDIRGDCAARNQLVVLVVALATAATATNKPH
jgi:hypothetical protein